MYRSKFVKKAGGGKKCSNCGVNKLKKVLKVKSTNKRSKKSKRSKRSNKPKRYNKSNKSKKGGMIRAPSVQKLRLGDSSN